MRKKKDKSGIVKFNSYRGIYKPKNLPKEHPANKNIYNAVGKEFIFTAVFKDDGIWNFFASNELDNSSVRLGAVSIEDISFNPHLA